MLLVNEKLVDVAANIVVAVVAAVVEQESGE